MATRELHEGKKRRQMNQVEQRWEDLNHDCLANVFGRVGMTALLLSVPFMCKSWYRASLDPSCLQRLIFTDVHTEIDLGNQGFWSSYNEIDASIDSRADLDRYVALRGRLELEYRVGISEVGLMKFAVNRSRGHATFLRLPQTYTELAVKHVANECDRLKGLSLHRCLLISSLSNILELIGKSKHLELLSLRRGTNNLKEILLQINIHCKDFGRLLLPNTVIDREDALAIVNLVPNIKYLSLRKSYIERYNLITVLRGCKELVLLDARDCSGFDEGDVKILELASHIDKFQL